MKSITFFRLRSATRVASMRLPRVTAEYFGEDLPPGNAELRRLIALRYLDTGRIVAPEGVMITTGALEAIFLCLKAVTRPGDTVAIETPTFYATLQMLEWMGLRAAEIGTDARKGIDLDALENAFEARSIKACVVIPTFQNPLGSCMPEGCKRECWRDWQSATRFR